MLASDLIQSWYAGTGLVDHTTLHRRLRESNPGCPLAHHEPRFSVLARGGLISKWARSTSQQLYISLSRSRRLIVFPASSILPQLRLHPSRPLRRRKREAHRMLEMPAVYYSVSAHGSLLSFLL